jgi:protein involved in polysaccharide export with SLBB domain
LDLDRQKWYKQFTDSPNVLLVRLYPTSELPTCGFYLSLLFQGGFVLRQLAFFIALVLCISYAELASAQTNNYTDTSRTNERLASPEAKAEAKRLHKEGVKYGLAGLFSQAAAIFEQAVRLDPQNADAHYSLGHAYFDLRQWKKVIGSFERVVELNPRDQEARDQLLLARTMAHQGPERAPTRPDTAPQSVPVAMNVKPAPPPPVKTETVRNELKEASESKVVSESKEPPEASEANANAAAIDLALTKIYRVGPSDVLDIRINDSSSPQSTLFTITSAGFLEHPLLAEPLQAGGLTVDEISARIESELKRRALIENPKVSVGVRDYASHMILVSGLVKDSGTKILRREAIPLYVVVADAQPLPEAASATVVRSGSSETFEIDLTQSGAMNLLVRPGDVITLLPNVTQFVYIGGEVKLPGEKTYRRGLTLTQAIISAGGVTPKSKEARVGRDDGKGFLNVTRFKLKDIESGKIQDPVIKAGDRITIED